VKVIVSDVGVWVVPTVIRVSPSLFAHNLTLWYDI
jgi:hypothetical protein